MHSTVDSTTGSLPPSTGEVTSIAALDRTVPVRREHWMADDQNTHTEAPTTSQDPG
jgi:hypothetical protein